MGDHPSVVFAHANGFCKEVWRPVVAELGARTSDVSWLSVDLLGHGDNVDGDGPFSLDTLSLDLSRRLSTVTGAVGVGHSSGGAAIARAETLDPGTFSHLVLIEPIIFPPPYRVIDIPLAHAAEKRRVVFSDRQAAYNRFVNGPFASWRQEALDAYVDFGFVDSPNGWMIKCQPAVEAEVFRQGLNHDTWDRIERIEVPATIVAGESSETHREPYLSSLADRFAESEVIIVPETGHFVPMERPDLIASIIALVLGDL
ncbi:MAG: alpha/beta fold hydrolase [Proteobacteria bacterium]|nr:alpha/beta fold hydrolase [Pseudomonadota bacterium]